MKTLVVFAAFAALALAAYKLHTDSLKSAADSAAREARADALRSRSKPAAPPILQAVAISRVVEPLYADLFSELDVARPADLAPPIDITKQRILDKKAHVNAEKQRIYDLGSSLLDAMAGLAEERTRTLQSLLESRATKGTLDAPNSTNSSAAFFAQSHLKRWEEEKRRQKPRLDQQFERLRSAEREWSKRVGEKAAVDSYDLPVFEPVYVTAEKPAIAANPLEKRAYDNRRVIYPWRRNYYDQYGYR